MATIIIAVVAAILSLIFGVVFLLTYKIYYKATTGWCRSYTCLVGKTAIITGANTGIGYYTALDLAKRGARVILACKSIDKALEAQQNIIEITSNKNVIAKEVDLSSFLSVREFAQSINKNEKRLDILVNNAAVWCVDSNKTSDDVEVTMQTNFFSHFLLTHLLIGLLKRSTPSRIINVSSIAAQRGRVDIDKLTIPLEEQTIFNKTQLYANSKLCQILFTKELARRLENTGVTVYSVHPGLATTAVYRKLLFPNTKIGGFITSWFFKTSEEGAQTTLHVALSNDVVDLSGEHFVDCKNVSTYRSAADDGLAKKLWDKSENVVQLKSNEVIF